MNLCLTWLDACRWVARRNGAPTAEDCTVTGETLFLVKSAAGRIVFDGSAHCKHCALAEAVITLGAEARDVPATPKPLHWFDANRNGFNDGSDS